MIICLKDRPPKVRASSSFLMRLPPPLIKAEQQKLLPGDLHPLCPITYKRISYGSAALCPPRRFVGRSIQSPGNSFFSLLIPLNSIFHVALSYLRMYACSPGTLWGEDPSEQVGSRVQHYGLTFSKESLTQQVLSEPS